MLRGACKATTAWRVNMASTPRSETSVTKRPFLGFGLVAIGCAGALLALAALTAGRAPRSDWATAPGAARPVTSTVTTTPTGTLTVEPTQAPTATAALTATATPTITAASTATITVTASATAEVSATRAPSMTAVATSTVTATATTTPTTSAEATASPTAAPSLAHVPFAANRNPATASVPQRIWGAQLAADHLVDLWAEDALVELPRMRAQGIRGVRTHINWSEIEPTDVAPSAYDLAATDARLAAYAAAGFDVVVSIVDYPAWATVYRCGFAVRDGQEAAWREFVGAVADRYSRPPYSVVAWEIGNEVDGETMIDASDWQRSEAWGRGEPTVPHGGCWGDRPEAYVAFLRVAAEAIDAAAPRAMVTLGNLALVDVPGFHADFLERFLAAGGGDLVDYVGFHWFPDLAEFFPNKGLPDGPGKAWQVIEALRRHGAAKPIWLTETYRLTREGDAGSELRQLEFITKDLVTLAATTPLERIYWYGWRDFAGVDLGATQRGLVRPDHAPKAALAAGALKAMIEATDGVATDASTADAVAYRFRPVRGGEVRYAAWSRSGEPTVLRVPLMAQRGTVADTVRFVTADGGIRAVRATVAPGADGLVIPLGAETTFVLLRSP